MLFLQKRYQAVRRPIVAPISAIIALFHIILLTASGHAQYFQAGAKIGDVLNLIGMTYVDTVNISRLEDDAIVSMLEGLDPHSVYISAEEMEQVKEEMEGNFEGIGIQFQVFHDTILVISPITGGPSERAGILAGDKIIRINGENSTGEKVNTKYVTDRLRGPGGTSVELGIKRGRHKEILKFTVVRDEIPISSVDAAFMVSDGIGYIRLNRFALNTMELFNQEFIGLKASGMEKLILDLRNNPGGYLYAAAELADHFLPDGKLIVYTEGDKSPRQTIEATGMGDFEKGMLVVLIDEGSASASEIVAGAVQDWGRGAVIGRRSFGKGLVQREFGLGDGSAVRITTARYYTPTGRCIQKPYYNGVEDYMMDLENRFYKGEFIHPDSIDFPDSLKYTTYDGRVVYGGGGIMPDVFVPLDSSWYSDFYFQLSSNNIFNEFVLEEMDARRTELLQKYPEIHSYIDEYQVDASVLARFIDFAVTNGVPLDDKDLEQSKLLIEYQIKALIARNLFDISSYFMVMSAIDQTFVRAVEWLRK